MKGIFFIGRVAIAMITKQMFNGWLTNVFKRVVFYKHYAFNFAPVNFEHCIGKRVQLIC